MIILRQKNNSKLGTRIVARYNRLSGKSPMESKRKAIRLKNKTFKDLVADGLNKAEEGKRLLEVTAANPGFVTNKVIEETIKRPITLSSNAVGKATMVTSPTGLGLVPIGTIGTAIEPSIRRKYPKYAKVTDNLAKKYRESKAPKYVETGVNSLYNYFKYL